MPSYRTLRLAACVLALILAVVLVDKAHAAVALDACSTQVQSSSGVTAFDVNNITVAAGLTGGVLVAIVAVESGGAISSVTASWDNAGTPQAMTQLGNVNNGSNAQLL